MSAVLKAAAPEAVVVKDDVVARSPRHNIYQVIHKALRAFMADTLLKFGRMDANDDGERAAASAQLRALLALCTSHLEHENDFIHAAIERRAPGGAARTAADHEHHEASIAALGAELARFESAPAFERARLAQALYLDLSAFVAENFSHMVTEEIDNHAALTAAYDEGEVLAIEQALVASLPPEEKFTVMGWMIPNINASERALLLGGIKRHAPREAFEALFGLARDTLSQRDLYKLERALGQADPA